MSRGSNFGSYTDVYRGRLKIDRIIPFKRKDEITQRRYYTHYGRHRQRKYFLLIFVATLSNAWHILVIIFLAPNIDHWCGGRPDVFHNMSEVEWKNFSVPVVAQETGQRSFSKCWMYDVMNNTNLNNTREVHYCFEWEYDHTQYKSSIVEQWNLVCNNSWMISLSQMFYMSSLMVYNRPTLG
ncbi:organic cation/carnitine transporter 2-like isoform X3 [Tachypleus tridentatus]|uniref:organic cation/carnitine transporter 2-like isoform X3 n=1 Tax=Tachypleus tridentatus TaxID=6853 RepID=UPI003FD6A2BA